jgi:hypothetical protein
MKCVPLPMAAVPAIAASGSTRGATRACIRRQCKRIRGRGMQRQQQHQQQPGDPCVTIGWRTRPWRTQQQQPQHQQQHRQCRRRCLQSRRCNIQLQSESLSQTQRPWTRPRRRHQQQQQQQQHRQCHRRCLQPRRCHCTLLTHFRLDLGSMSTAVAGLSVQTARRQAVSSSMPSASSATLGVGFPLLAPKRVRIHPPELDTTAMVSGFASSHQVTTSAITHECRRQIPAGPVPPLLTRIPALLPTLRWQLEVPGGSMSRETGLPAAEAAAATAAAVVAEAAMVAHTGLQLAAVDTPGGAAKAEAAPPGGAATAA